MQVRTRSVAWLLFGSGMASLVYQTAWQRMFRLVFGASTSASAAVLGVFLGGLGVGALLLGKRAEQSERPLFYYGNLELGVASLSALTPLLLEICSRLYLALGGSTALGTGGATLVRLCIATLVLGPPVMLMGGTLPAAARAVESESDTARGRLAFLYAANTSGAVVGALLSTFVTFELLGTRLSLWGAAALNLLVAVLARGLGRDAPAIGVEAAANVSGAEERAAPAVPVRLIYAAAAVAGLVFAGLELVWYRMLAPILGGSSFTYGLIVAVALAGMGAGGFSYARRAPGRQVSLDLLAWTLVLEALAVAVPFWLGDSIALYAADTRSLSGIGFSALVLAWSSVSALVVFPAAFVAGYQFPVIFALLGRGRQQVARHVGLAYAFNTLGSIAGAWAGGLALIPSLGVVRSWRWFGVALLVSGALVLAQAVRARRREEIGGRVLLLATGAISALALGARGPTALWRQSPIGAGRFEVPSDRNLLLAQERRVQRSLAWEQDGVESTVGVLTNDGISFNVNGKSDGAVRFDRGTQGMLGLVAAALHPEPKSAFVVGLGTGMTAGWLAAVPGMARVDVAELEPAVLRVARESSLANHDVLNQPNVHIIEGDGRERLLTSTASYDLIVSEPSNPYRAGMALLFTREFYQAVEARLAQGGIFAQWIQGYEVDALTLRIVLSTLRSVLPQVEIWHTQSDDLVLLATRAPLLHDLRSIGARLAAEPYRSALPRLWLVEGVEGFFAHFLAPADVVEKITLAVPTPLNTDDETVLEYALARQVGSGNGRISQQLFELGAALDREQPLLRGELDTRRMRELRPRAWWISGETSPPLPHAADRRRAQIAALEDSCVGHGSDAPAQARVSSAAGDPAGAEPGDVVERFLTALNAAARAEPGVLDVADALDQRGFVAESRLVRGDFHLASGATELAFKELLEGLEQLHQDPLTLCNTASGTLHALAFAAAKSPERSLQLYRALTRGPLAAYVSEDERAELEREVGFGLADHTLCVPALGSALELPPWDLAVLEQRVSCLQRVQHPLLAEAQADVGRYLENTLGRIDTGIDLAPRPAASVRNDPPVPLAPALP